MAFEKTDWCFVCSITQATGLEEAHNIFKGEIIADLAAKNDPGLQLLLMDVSTIPENFALPKSLRYLFLCNE